MGKASMVARHVLVGRGVHYRNAAGVVERQGVVLGVVPSGDPVVGEVALVRWFDWVVGDPWNEELVPIAEMAKERERWTLYDSCEGMNHAWETRERDRMREARR